MAKKKEAILIFCAHNDDQTIGAGGTIKNCIKNNKKAYTYIFSYGESSHPHLKPEVVAKMREKESIQAARILGDEIHYLGLKEGKFIETFNKDEIKKIIKKINPTKVFTHSPDDMHPDHRAVYKIIKKTLKGMNYKGDMYAFDVWNLFSFKTRDYPKLFMDISDTFKDKLKALEKHKSQILAIILLKWNIYLKAFVNGINNNCKYAELFHKIDFKN